MDWVQNYNPLASAFWSPLVAALPIVVLTGLLLSGVAAWRAAMSGLAIAVAVAVVVFKMPAAAAASAALYGTCFGLMPIGWIVFSAVFLYNLTVRSGQFQVVKYSVAAISPDRRMQALLIAFCFGSFLEGGAGFGAPVAITSALLIGLGFPPLYAAGLALLANTSPVAFGSIGIPITTLAHVAGVNELALGQMAAQQLTPFALIIPAWLVVVMSGWKGLKGAWLAVLLCGGCYATIQLVVATFHGPSLVNVLSGLGSLVLLTILLRLWQPKEICGFPEERVAASGSEASNGTTVATAPAQSAGQIAYAWMPWVLLSAAISLWGWPACKDVLDRGFLAAAQAVGGGESSKITMPGLNVYRTFPAEAAAPGTDRAAKPMEATYDYNFLATSGSGVFLAAIAAAFWLRISPRVFLDEFWKTLMGVRWALLTIACMLALAYTMKFSGADVTLGMVFVHTGRFYPLFAPLLGWVGVVVTGSDTSSNAMFGSLQRITAQRLGLNPVLIVASNSTGGVMGKMIAAQSVAVAAAATDQKNGEGRILRFVLLHSIVLAVLVGLLTMAMQMLHS